MKTKSLTLPAVLVLAGLTITTASAQNIFVANQNSGKVLEFSPGGTLINASFASGFGGDIVGLAIDSSGNLYGAGFNNNTVSKFSPTGTLINASYASGERPYLSGL